MTFKKYRIGPSFQSVIMKIGANGEYLFQNTKIIKQGLHMTLFSNVLQNSFKVIYGDQTTMETSTLPVICIFKRSNRII